MCWAAAITTISNYKNNTNLTAMQVADIAGMDYEKGAYLSQAQVAMRNAGLYFRMRNSYLAFDSVKSNIRGKSPIYIAGAGHTNNGESVGHAITIYGYKEVVGEQCLMVWDSASNGNRGDSYIVSYNGASTVYSSAQNSTVYTWNGTLSNYK